MKGMVFIPLLITCSLLFATGKGREVSMDRSEFTADSLNNDPTLASLVAAGYALNISPYSLKELNMVLLENKNTLFLLGQSQEGRKINAFYIPGTSNLRAMVIGGIHGSELSSTEVAYRLVSQLLQSKQPYYSVIIVPSLFPDNAARAMDRPELIGSTDNIGRYTYPHAVDPNRQMPSPGKAYNEINGLDHNNRKIEQENRFLLELIQAFKPQRIAALHAIRDMNYGGVYADPRTDHNNMALGYDSDSSLAIDMALYIHQQGANVAGNYPDKKPTALYYKDPEPAPAGSLQKRNMSAPSLKAKRGSGTSLGIWGSTAIADEKDVSKNRDAMRILTIEYPGYKRPADYNTDAEQLFQLKQSAAFATALQIFFLEKFYTEKESNEIARE